MNPVEHYKIATEDIEGILFGPVIQNDDPDGLHRVKVRVRGKFEAPGVKKEHIPWAVPVMGTKVPELGTEVAVLFMRGDMERPIYLPEGFLDKANITRWLSIYERVIEERKNKAKTGVSVAGSSFDEPETTAEPTFTYTKDINIMPEDVAKESGEDVEKGEPEKALIVEAEVTGGSERWSVTHVAGSFIEIHANGDMVMHSAANSFYIVEGNHNEYATGNRLAKVDGNYLMEAGQGMTIKVGQATIEISSAGKIQITGPQFQVDGLAVPSPGKGPFCALPNCVFSGAPHVGNISANN